jgi:hypothetical protein
MVSFGLVAGVVLNGVDAGRQARVNGHAGSEHAPWTAQRWVVAKFRLEPLVHNEIDCGDRLAAGAVLRGGPPSDRSVEHAQGSGVTLSQGLSVNAGWSFLVFDQLRPGDVLGKPPGNAAWWASAAQSSEEVILALHTSPVEAVTKLRGDVQADLRVIFFARPRSGGYAHSDSDDASCPSERGCAAALVLPGTDPNHDASTL